MQTLDVRRPRGRLCCVALGLAVVVGASGVATPAHAASKTDDRTTITALARSDDRISMPRRNLTPTISARRALGELFIDRVTIAFDVRIGKQTIGRLSGLVDLESGGADLRYIAPDQDGKLLADPFNVRVRGQRIQIGLPANLRTQSGVDGYVTTIREGAYGGVGVADEVLIPIALLTALPLPMSVPTWNAAKPTAPKGTATTSKAPAVTVAPSRLQGVATRTDFTVLSKDRFGNTADVELNLRSGKLRDLAISFRPLKTPETKGLQPVVLVGTLSRTAKTLSGAAPIGKFLTASKFFDLDPLPEDVDVPAQSPTGIAAEAT